MRNVLSRGNREVLEQFAWSNVLLAFDYDGTLAPIVAERRRAAMRAPTRRLLGALVERYPCAVISGRARSDVSRLLDGVGVPEVVGNHGMESRQATERFAFEVRGWMPFLERRLGGLRGLEIEDKRFSVAIHYRQSREKKRARTVIRAAVESLAGARIVPGKLVTNVMPRGAPHKGIALETLRERMGCDTAVYVGDDETDEDVFALDQPGRLLSIQVGTRRGSAAHYCIPRQTDVDRLLATFLALRPAAARAQGSR